MGNCLSATGAGSNSYEFSSTAPPKPNQDSQGFKKKSDGKNNGGNVHRSYGVSYHSNGGGGYSSGRGGSGLYGDSANGVSRSAM